MVEAFSVERIGKSGTKFDIAKAKWFNEQYLKAKSNSELAQYVITDAAEEEITILQDTAEALVGLMKERVTFPAEIWKGSRFVVVAPNEFDQDIAGKRWNADAVTVLSAYAESLEGFTGDYDAEKAKSMLGETAEAKDIKLGKVMQAVRLAVTGSGVGPDMMEIFAILGAEEAAKRIRFALATLDVIG